MQATIDWLPCLAGVVGAKRASGRDGNEDSVRVARIQKDRMQAHPAGAWLPSGPRPVDAQTGKLFPRLPTVRRAEQRRVFNPGVDSVRIAQRRFEMPDAIELPGVRHAVVP